jgi:hypothetical protein
VAAEERTRIVQEARHRQPEASGPELIEGARKLCCEI